MRTTASYLGVVNPERIWEEEKVSVCLACLPIDDWIMFELIIQGFKMKVFDYSNEFTYN